ncbi:HxlR family transcriptional regulator [Sinobacterium caligoides]|uniref:HxlR family transcriptional regulator n=1 Tax=Sinobacterium caligoides TaxID=933926 RepID=A0A3N2DEY1_9GAMM|nr:helix-turn-helix domain-containing protein [Sinobacterium caligoides]ROR97984.1 HxlR family transcriptional regulator [Sinobacterium caligoides]
MKKTENTSVAGDAPASSSRRSSCAISCGLDLLGDKWSLLIIRDMFLGAQTYGELQASSEAIPTNILSSRLKRLQASGLVTRSAYQQRPVRYHYQLTEKGRDLGPLLIELIRWSDKHIAGVHIDERVRGYLR